MPLPPEVLANIKNRITEGRKSLESIKDVIEDLRAVGIDASKQEELYRTTEAGIIQMEGFIERQEAR